MKPCLITIDGPAGAGKTTVSREVARRLGYTYVDTGALYRAVALAVDSQGCPTHDDDRIRQLCDTLSIHFNDEAGDPRLYVNGHDVTDKIRGQQITMLASALSAKAVVRQYLLEVQRQLGQNGPAVFEGRDMGTVVFPDADIKFFLDADFKVRAGRRHKELLDKGDQIDLEVVEENMKKRDKDDSQRALAPLKAAQDAIRIDSTNKRVNEVVDEMLGYVRNPVA